MTHPHPLIHPTFCYMHVLISYNVAYVQHEINTTKFELSLDMLFFLSETKFLIVVCMHSLAVFQIDQVLSVYQHAWSAQHALQQRHYQYCTQHTYRYKIPKFSFLAIQVYVIQFDYH